MKAEAEGVLDFLKNSSQFIIPIYQRTYSWDFEQCQQLWDDILKAGTSDMTKVHFIGSIVYVAEDMPTATRQSQWLVIDGQQRLTTVTLLLQALYEALGDTEPIEGFSAAKIKGYYLTRPLESEDKYFKLLLSQSDASTLKSIIRQKELPQDYSIRVSENFEFFKAMIAGLKENLIELCDGLAKLAIVHVTLVRGEDNPQLIFESMNSTGKALSQADLIRNYILMGLQPDLQEQLYEDYWRPMELDFGQKAYAEDFDAFMRHYLTMKNHVTPRIDQVYETFKQYAVSVETKEFGIEPLVKDIRQFAAMYCAMTLGKEKNEKLQDAFVSLADFKVEVAYPFLLEAYGDEQTGLITKSILTEIVRLVENYAFRRYVVQLQPNSMSRTFARFSLSIDKNNYLESVKAHFASLVSHRHFPTDEEFKSSLRLRDLYHTRNNFWWLARIESHGHKEIANLDEFTVEHVMPQNKELNDWWKTALGDDFTNVQEKYLHTIGNLTLTRYNSEFSDRSFLEKRDHPEGGFSKTNLRLNQGLRGLQTWNESEISARADTLIIGALKVWPTLAADPELVKKIASEKKKEPKTNYTYADHKYLTYPGIMDLFKVLQKEVLAIDPEVYEDTLKYYIAFKAETNFVDVITQAKKLRLMINLRFRDVRDPDGKCKDISGAGSWGNGEVALDISNVEEIEYAMFIIKQAFDAQFELASE